MAPSPAGKAKNTCCAYRKLEDVVARFKLPTLAPDGEEHRVEDVEGLVEELHAHARWAGEESLIDAPYLRPSPLDSAERIVHSRFL